LISSKQLETMTDVKVARKLNRAFSRQHQAPWIQNTTGNEPSLDSHRGQAAGKMPDEEWRGSSAEPWRRAHAEAHVHIQYFISIRRRQPGIRSRYSAHTVTHSDEVNYE